MRKLASTPRPPTPIAPRTRTRGRTRTAASVVATAVLAAVAAIAAPTPLSAATAAAPAAAPLATTAACNPLPITLPAPANRHTSAKKVWAYYFPPFPLAVDSPDPLRDVYNRWQNTRNSTGGAYDLRDRPQLPQRTVETVWRQADFEQEVRQAVEAGLDGFIWEYHTSSDQRWNQLPAMLAAAKKVDPGFRIMLSPDFNTAAGSTSDSVYNDVMKVKDDPAIYRNGSGIVLAPFFPERKTPSWWDGLRNRLASSGVKTNLVPIFISWGGGTTQKLEWNNSVSGYSHWGTRTASGVPNLARESAEAHRRGKTWMQPVAFEDSRSYDGRYWESSNSSTLRDSLMSAINSNADSIAFITWNDYTESWVAPSKQRGFAVMDMAAYYISWFKSGVKPAITQDALYWNHRAHPANAAYSKTAIGRNGLPAPMHIANGDAAKNEVELVAVLKSPGRLTITQGSNVRAMDAPAGLTSFKVPMVAGTTPSFKLARVGTTVHSITSNTPVRSSVVYQDMIYHAGGGVAAPCAR